MSESRFIPAHAGNRHPRRSPGTSLPVHPRACGEQVCSSCASRSSTGSSPRMRGTVSRTSRLDTRQRFIPAHAGNSGAGISGRSMFTVHPRACGEQPSAPRCSTCVGGSSPRMRGTGRIFVLEPDASRFIPAHAGNSEFRSVAQAGATVHPRACGEQTALSTAATTGSGSSPRMRGTGLLGVARHAPLRFIPAHAGNSPCRRARPGAGTVHPRACGEQWGLFFKRLREDGSSPRMRGTASRQHEHATHCRFIPAHAGNRVASRGQRTSKSVHPRACGEQHSSWVSFRGICGSSPRMRGTGDVSKLPGRLVRFIPAHAGNRSSRGVS